MGAFAWGPPTAGRRLRRALRRRGREELAARLTVVTDQPFAVVGQQAGVRPAVRDRRPLIGPHPTMPHLSFCGGYGSKGVMLAPRLAALLADWLVGEAEIWPDASVQRYSALQPAAAQ